MRRTPRIDPDELLDCVLGHKAEFTREFLASHGVARYGTKAQLRERLEEFLEGEDGRRIALAQHLDRIEGWGNQHVYLYRAPHVLCREWLREEHVRDVLRNNNCLSRLNAHHPVLLPNERTLSKVEWGERRLRFLWTEKRSWEERDHAQDEESGDGNVHWKAYVRRTARATLSFDWDLVSGHAMLLIRQLHRGADYETARDDLSRTLRPFVDLSRFTPIRLNRTIVRVRESGEVRGRLRTFLTNRGGRVSLRSPSRGTDIKDDPELERAEAGFRDSANNYGNFYWLAARSSDNLQGDIRTTMHAEDHRIGIYGERLESEVRYVIGRIRHHSQ